MSDIRKILNTLTEMTSGSVASVSMPLTTQRRQDHVDENDAKSQSHDVLEYGNWENSALTTSKKLKQTRSKAKKLVKKIYGEAVAAESMDGVAPSTKMFTSEGKTKNPVAKAAQRVAKGSGKHKNPAKVLPRKAKHKKMYEEEITEQDLIISPVIRRGRDRDLISRDHSRIDREVEMARGDVHQAQQNAAKILAMIQDRSEQEGLEGWVQEKIIKASDYLNTVREYLENKGQEQGVAEGLSDPTRKVFFKVIKTQGTGMPSGYRRVKTITPLEDGGFYIELSTPGYGMNYTRHNYKNFSLTDGQGKPITGQEAYDIINGQQDVAEGSDHDDDDYSTASFEKWKKQKEYEKEYDKKKPAKPIVPDNKDKKKGVAEGYSGRKNEDGTWTVYKDGEKVAGVNPFKNKELAKQWIASAWLKDKNEKQGVAEGLTKRARAKKEAESVKAVIARLEQELKDTNPHIDKDDIHRRLETEKRRLELYRDVLDDKDVTEGFSDVVKGIKRSIKGKEHPDVVASKHAGRARGHYNQGDIPAGDKETERYVKTRDIHLKAKGVAEGSTEQVYKVLAVDKSNALSKQVKLKVKANSLDEVFERLAINDWYPLEINGVEVINGKRLKQGVAEGSDQFLVYISVDRVEAFEDWMNSEGLETNVPKTDEGTYVVYDYSNADHRSKMYAGEWNEKKGVAEDLDANQRRVGQLGPTEKIGKRGTRGRLVGGN